MGKKVKKEPEPPPKDVFDPLPVESKKAATVVLLLHSPEEEVLAKACEAIQKFAEKGDENKSSLLALGAVEPLSALISHDDKAARQSAVMAMGVLASNNDVLALLKKLDVIPSLIARLSPEENVAVHEFATLSLASLSVDFSCKVQIFEQGGLEPLITLLSSPDPDVRKNSVECIFNLVQDGPCRQAAARLDGIPPLLALIRSEFPVIQRLTLRTLERVSADPEGRSTLRHAEGFPRLLDVLATKEFGDLHMDVLQIFSNCLADGEALQAIQETGGLENLLQFIVTATPPEVQASAVEVITRAMQSDRNRRLLHEQDVEKVLIQLLAVDSEQVRTAACQAIGAMSQSLASSDTCRLLDGISPIVQLLSSDGGAVREAAAQALSNLTHGNQLNANAVFEAEGVKLLVQQLQGGQQGAAAYSSAALTNMAEQEVLRRSILAHGAMQALVVPLGSLDKHTLVSATQAVAALACDAEGRRELSSTGGLTPLVNLLKSCDAEIRRNACWAVSVCASDEPTAAEMCRLGALAVLQELNSSSSRKNRFSQGAFRRLLDHNLSVKYSLTGCLSSSDIIKDGFYDPGQTRMGHRVPALEDIAQQAINQHRAAIAVNGQPHDHDTGKGGGRGADETERWLQPCDPAFLSLASEASKALQPLHDPAHTYATLARLVCEAMGGAVEEEREHDFLWELHLSELKLELQSNVIPIGKIQKGTYYHRALLFKALADQVGVGCSLVRGDYNRAWNEVLLTPDPQRGLGHYARPRSYVVDLMHNPGALLPSNSPAAAQYQTI